MGKHTASRSTDPTTRPDTTYRPRHDADNPVAHQTGTTRRELARQAIRNRRHGGR